MVSLLLKIFNNIIEMLNPQVQQSCAILLNRVRSLNFRLCPPTHHSFFTFALSGKNPLLSNIPEPYLSQIFEMPIEFMFYLIRIGDSTYYKFKLIRCRANAAIIHWKLHLETSLQGLYKQAKTQPLNYHLLWLFLSCRLIQLSLNKE